MDSVRHHGSVLPALALIGAVAAAALAAPAGALPAKSAAARVEHALLGRGYDRARAQCRTEPTVNRCRARGIYRNRNGAVERCRVHATVAGGNVRLNGQRCGQIAPAPPWPRLGFNGANDFSSADIARTEQVGAATSRLFVYWSMIERSPGVYDFGGFQTQYNALVAAGTPPVISVAQAPTWAQGAQPACPRAEGCAYPPAPAYDDAWKRFIGVLIAHMPEAVGIEVWSEPNFDGGWSPQPDPERYAELVSMANEAASRTPQDPPIVFAGLAGGSAESMPPAEFLRRAYEHGVSYDVLGAHVYPSKARNGSFTPAMLAQLDALWGVADDYGQVPVTWLTELGVSSGDIGKKAADASGQAKALVELYRAARRTRRIPLVIVHKLHDGPDIDHSAWGDHLGLLNADDSPKPAFCALAALRLLPCG
jgi:hypothetical protein